MKKVKFLKRDQGDPWEICSGFNRKSENFLKKSENSRNSLQIRDQRPRFTPVADFRRVHLKKSKILKIKGGLMGNYSNFPLKPEQISQGSPRWFEGENRLQIRD